jgi:hypothetical protein
MTTLPPPHTDAAEQIETVERIGDGHLEFRFSRRQVLSELVEWSRVVATSPAKPARKLTDLADLDVEQWAAMRPRITPGCTISSREGRVWAQPLGATDRIPLLPASGPGLCVFNAINGTTTVAEIADLVAAETGWSDDQAFEFCRSTVLHLVGLRVCIPATRT